MAVIARDAGCSFPGCTHPASWCDRHHIVDWILGGLTDLDNLTLLCRHHSHFLQKGCSCRLNADRLPEWTPPRWIDQDQRPQINTASHDSTHNTNSTAATDGDERRQLHDRLRPKTRPYDGAAGTAPAMLAVCTRSPRLG
jgi:hypothetical protein